MYVLGDRQKPAVVLLHEMPGLSPADLALGERLARSGFAIYMPLLFGELRQDAALTGYFQSCMTSSFTCSTKARSSKIITWLKQVCARIARDRTGPIGVVGMCLTGAFPLALLGPRVTAAVLCQPTLPFSIVPGWPLGAQKRDLGLHPDDLQPALSSRAPLLTLRYASDRMCPRERIATLARTFPGRVGVIELEGDGHSTLAGRCHPDAVADTVSYLTARLGAPTATQRMRRVTLEGRKVDMTGNGEWTPA